MYRVQSDYIRHLSKKEYVMLAEMCRYSNNLYNVAVYNIRQQFFRGEGYLPYEKNYKLCKANENYGLLQAGVTQQTLKMADRSFQSFFALLKLKKEGGYDKKVRIPHYRERGRSVRPHAVDECHQHQERLAPGADEPRLLEVS